ncbi:hypothetical protein [Streptomyces sp. NPDC021020]|uniref:wHTH domain-containing protein n=1 Tax=Streptomyces sp. NPDC021020 TaxID=3365109 RepID=UPI0037AB21E8
MGDIGFVPVDHLLLPLVTPAIDHGLDLVRGAALLRCTSVAVLSWRLPVLHRAVEGAAFNGPAPGAPAQALPSDFVLLHHVGQHERWLDDLRQWCDSAEWQVRTLTRRDDIERALLNLSDLTSWRSPDSEVDVASVLDLTAVCEFTAGEVAGRLRQLGYRVAPLAGLEAAGTADLALLRPLADPLGWLPQRVDLPAAQVACSALRAEVPVEDAARRLRELGYSVPLAPEGTVHRSSAQRALIDQLWECLQDRPALGDAARVGTAQLVLTAAACGRTVTETAAQLSALGFHLPPPSGRPDLRTDDHLLLSYDDRTPWADRPVHPLYLFAVAARARQPLDFVIGRLRELGFEVTDVPEEERPRLQDATDTVIRFGQYSNVASHLQALTGGPRRRRMRVRQVLREAISQLEAAGSGTRPAPPSTAAAPRGHALLTVARSYALTERMGTTRAEGTRILAAEGYEPPAPEPEFERDLAAEQWLQTALTFPDVRLPTVPGHTSVGLAGLCAVAFRNRRTLREIALLATRLGMRHEAESWFGPSKTTSPAEGA